LIVEVSQVEVLWPLAVSVHVSSTPYITIPFPRLNRAMLRHRAFQNPRELRPDRP
jgi:hypothetical protein